MMEQKTCCGKGKYISNEKLGTCTKCIVSSICLSIMAWGVYFYTLKFPLGTFLRGIFLFFSIVFTTLMLSHFFAFLSKRKSRK